MDTFAKPEHAPPCPIALSKRRPDDPDDAIVNVRTAHPRSRVGPFDVYVDYCVAMDHVRGVVAEWYVAVVVGETRDVLLDDDGPYTDALDAEHAGREYAYYLLGVA